MELFHEMYGCYYQVVARILRQAHSVGISREQIDEIVKRYAFSESSFHLMPRLLSGEWDLLRQKDGLYVSKLRYIDTRLPLTALQKSWLKALLQDNRIRLFLDEAQLEKMERFLTAVQPLFDVHDFHAFDSATDGDNYDDDEYIRRFRVMLRAVKEKAPLFVEYERGKGGRTRLCFLPERILYSNKDDKFRAMGFQIIRTKRNPIILNMARIINIEELKQNIPAQNTYRSMQQNSMRRKVTIAIYKERNALERCMLQFASYEKQTRYDDASGCYNCEITYNNEEETELLIRILSFGPCIEVLGPQSFRKQVKERVSQQIFRIKTDMGLC